MARATIDGPFGEPNRVRLINQFFGTRQLSPEEAWKDVYRLLLWTDQRTGIAHCYESDKSQPGRRWYSRSLEFHEWVADQLEVDPIDLKDHIDWLFRRVMEVVTAAEADEMVSDALAAQRSLPLGREMPVPGDDPRLLAIVEKVMSDDPAQRPSEEAVTGVLREIYAHMGSENKRKNLLGRGFESVLDGVIGRLPTRPVDHDTQTSIEQIPGFRPVREGDKAEKVDLWVGDGKRRRVMVSAKWSVRADREKQMATDAQTYFQANEWRERFEYVWITNEFDPARLVANATNMQFNAPIFDRVVHVCPAALGVVHQLYGEKPPVKTPARLKDLLEEGRIVGLDWFLRDISS